MKWSFRIARVTGIEVRVHVTFLMLLAWIGGAYYLFGGLPAAIDGVLFILLIFLCVILHEFGHALAARRYGIPTPDITLLPIGGLARLQRMPDEPAQELVIALAGPAVNVVLAVVLIVLAGDLSSVEELGDLDHTPRELLARIALVNVILAVFNMIPAFPMDGGRVLRALLASVTSYGTATTIAARIGQGIAFLFGFVGLFWNPLLIFIALFVYLGAAREAAAVQVRDHSIDVPVTEAMMTRFAVLPDDAPLEHAVDLLIRTAQHEFPVVDEEGEIRGVLTREDMIGALRRGLAGARVSDIMHRDVPSVRADAGLADAIARMQDCACPAIPVVDRRGRVVGLVTPETAGEHLIVRPVLAQLRRPVRARWP